MSYTYDLAGNVQTLTDATNNGLVQTFGYDWLDRLTSAATTAIGISQYSHTYAYNAIGNLTNYNGNAYTYDGRPPAVTSAFGNSYGYGAVGNQTSRIIAEVNIHPDLRLRQPAGGRGDGSIDASFVYDAEGQRVKGTVGGVTTVYMHRGCTSGRTAVTQFYEGGCAPQVRLRHGQRRILRGERSPAFDQRAGQPKRHGQGPELLLSLRRQSRGSAFSGVTTEAFLTGQYHEQGCPAAS